MKTTIYTVTLILMVLIFPKVSEACKCGRIAQNSEVALKNALISADLVIKGTVSSVTSTVLPEVTDDINLNDLSYLPGSSGEVAVILVENFWKGDNSTFEIQLFIGSTL
jgi:hypothetical protein